MLKFLMHVVKGEAACTLWTRSWLVCKIYIPSRDCIQCCINHFVLSCAITRTIVMPILQVVSMIVLCLIIYWPVCKINPVQMKTSIKMGLHFSKIDLYWVSTGNLMHWNLFFFVVAFFMVFSLFTDPFSSLIS